MFFLKLITNLLQVRKIFSSNQSTDPLPQTNSGIENPTNSNEHEKIKFIDLECSIFCTNRTNQEASYFILIESQGQLSEISKKNIKNIFILDNDQIRIQKNLQKLNSEEYYITSNYNINEIQMKPETIKKKIYW